MALWQAVCSRLNSEVASAEVRHQAGKHTSAARIVSNCRLSAEAKAGSCRRVFSSLGDRALMSVVVRPADLQADRVQLIRSLSEYINPSADARRFDWLYLQNPHGTARAWLAKDGASGHYIGVSAIFPRRMKVRQQEITACIFGDFGIERDYRTLGPALLLQRATISGMRAAGFAFGYDLPSTSMLGVYRRLNIAPRESLVRMAKPLRANRKVSRSVRPAVIARSVSAAANFMLAKRDSLRRSRGRAAITPHEGRFAEEFTALANRVDAAGSGHIHRTAEYLNWRFLDHPHCRFEILTAREEKQVKGYIVFLEEGGDARIVDWFAEDPVEIRRALVAQAIDILRSRGCETLSLPISASHPWCSDLKTLGFRPRESQPIVTLDNQTDAAEEPSWLFLEGDRES
jgi:GNAT superfamily N-acetyltransferase